MTEAMPNRNIAATAFNPASNAQAEHGHLLRDAADGLPPTDNRKNEASPESSNVSAAQLRNPTATVLAHLHKLQHDLQRLIPKANQS